MARSNYLITLLVGILLFVTGFASAKPVKHVYDFNFKAGNNRLDCPAAGQTKYVGPYGGQWVRSRQFSNVCIPLRFYRAFFVAGIPR